MEACEPVQTDDSFGHDGAAITDERYAALLLRLRRKFWYADEDDLKDALQDALVAVLLEDIWHLPVHEQDNWIFSVAARKLIDSLRRRKKLVRMESDAEEPCLASRDGEAEVETDYQLFLVSLAEMEREAVMCFHDGLTPDEIADRLGVCQRTTYNLKGKMREKIHVWFNLFRRNGLG